MKYKNIIFDLDGTLTDSKEGIIKTIKYSLDKMGVDYSKANLNSFIGPPLLDSFMTELSMTKEASMLAISYYQERFNLIGKFENRVYDGIGELLFRLKKLGCNLLVATTKPEIFAIQILEHFSLAKFFTVIVGGSYDQKLSDKSEIIAICLNKAHISSQDTVMIGDRKHDIIGAKNNNLDSIGVLYGYGDRQELENEKADFIITTVGELSDFLVK